MQKDPPAYVLADNDVHDTEAYAEYIALIAPTVEAYGGTYLVRGGDVEMISGARHWERVVLIRFPDLDTAKAWLADPELAPIHDMRRQNATTEMVILSGIT